MKSITDATWKDAAVIEVRSLIARLETIAATCMANPKAMLTAPVKQIELESVTRQAVKLADMIDRIDEKKQPKRATRKRIATTVVLLLLALATPAFAQGQPPQKEGRFSQLAPYFVLAGGQFADGFVGSRYNPDWCREGTARYAQPNTAILDTPKMVRDKVLYVAAVSAFVYVTGRSDSKLTRWLGKSTAYFGGGYGAFHATRSLVVCKGW